MELLRRSQGPDAGLCLHKARANWLQIEEERYKADYNRYLDKELPEKGIFRAWAGQPESKVSVIYRTKLSLQCFVMVMHGALD